jgi:L-ascorbate metabolism protein UlaG (beta-lactamase superfamily)
MKDSHLNPKEALEAMQDVKAKAAIGIHWGTFDGMSDEPLDQAPKDLEIAKKGSSVPLNFFVLKHGQSWTSGASRNTP